MRLSHHRRRLALGVAPRPAAEFSFLLGIIAVAGAAVLTLSDLGDASPELMSAVMTGGAAASVGGSQATPIVVIAEAPGFLKEQIDLRLQDNDFVAERHVLPILFVAASPAHSTPPQFRS